MYAPKHVDAERSTNEEGSLISAQHNGRLINLGGNRPEAQVRYRKAILNDH